MAFLGGMTRAMSRYMRKMLICSGYLERRGGGSRFLEPKCDTN